MSSTSKAENVKKQTLKDALDYIDEKLLNYLKCMSKIQQKVLDQYKSDADFKYFRLHDMTTYIKVADLLATEWASDEISSFYEKSTTFWLDKLLPIATSNPKTLATEVKARLVKQGRIIAALALLNGHYHKALTFLISLYDLYPRDTFVAALLLKWTCLLHEFEMFKKYECESSTNDELTPLVKATRLYTAFFSETNYEEQLNIIDQAYELKTSIDQEKPPTYFGFFALQLLYNLLSTGAQLPLFDVKKYTDYVHLSKKETDRTRSIVTSRFKNFVNQEGLLIIYESEVLPDSSSFLKAVSSIPDHFDGEVRHATALFENGDLFDAENKMCYAFFTATKTGNPFRILQCLNFLYQLKLRTLNDQEKLKSLGAVLALLLGRVFERKNKACKYRTELLADKYVLPLKSDSLSILANTVISKIPSIPKHVDRCDCYLCYEMGANDLFFAERKYTDLLINSFAINDCDDYCTSMEDQCYRRLYHQRKIMLKMFLKKDPSKEEKSKVFVDVLRYICQAYCNCLLLNKDIEWNVQHRIAKQIVQWSDFSPVRLRYYWLLGRHFQRKKYLLNSFPWIESTKTKEKFDLDGFANCFSAFGISSERSKSPSREVMRRRANVYKKHGKDGLISDNDEVPSARADFKSYQHLFYIEWRHRLCNYLGAHLAKCYPWYSAWYFIESRACGLRQCVRLRDKDPDDMRFKDIDSFKTAIRSLPEDFTVIQLILDCYNVLWLVRCNAGFAPIVLPITHVDIGRDDVAYKMYEILVENDKTVEPDFPQKSFWNARYNIDLKLKSLIRELEKKWLSNFHALMIPFGKPSPDIKRKVLKLEEILKKHEFSEEGSQFLARLFLHASQEDFQFLLKIFERDMFSEPFDKNELYVELLSKAGLSTIGVKKYLGQDRYTVFIVSPELSTYPWECLPTLSENPLVLRTQSLHFFVRLLKKASSSLPMTASSKKSFYLLNPGGDLKKTEQRFEERIDLEKLQGIKGQPPDNNKFPEVLKENDYYLYIGHGSGSRYFHSATIKRTLCKAVTILMGCSSVRIEDEGRGFDGKSAVNDYAVAGSPCTIGCLWMVTDGEIDKFFIAFLEACFIEWSKAKNSLSSNITDEKICYRLLIRALVRARDACKLKYLTAGSVVVYGIPVFNDQSAMESSTSQNTEPDVVIIDD